MISDTYRSYVAGFFDGEGCVTFQAYYKKGKYEKYPRIVMQINITQTSKEVLEYIQKEFGGSIHFKKSKNINHKSCYKLVLTNRENMKFFLENIVEFCIVKHDDIILGLEFVNTLRSENLGCVSLPEEVHNIRRKIYNESSKNIKQVPVRSDSYTQIPNMLEHPERAISRHRPYGKAPETTKGHLDTDDGIVRTTWEHVETDRNDQFSSQNEVTDGFGHSVS